MPADRDHYGNEWAVIDGRLQTTTPSSEVLVVWDRRDALAQDVATDDHGFIWLIAGDRVHFCNPRATADSEPPDGSEPAPGSPETWTTVEYLPGTPIRLKRSDAGMMLAHCAAETEVVVEMQVKGRNIGGPFTSSHTTEVTVSTDLTPASTDWDILPARLPSGTHDNHCTTADGRVFLVGGATHHYGFPATNHVHDELLAYDPADPESGWVGVGRLPEGSIYSAMASLEGRVYVIGGGGRGRRMAECWTFDASSTCEADSDRQKAPSLPSPRFGHVAAATNGRIWIVGGTGGDRTSGSQHLRELLSIAPGESEWRVEPPAPVSLPIATLAGCELDGVIYVLGGVPARFRAFDTATGTWDENLPDHPLRSQASAMAAHNGQIWVCGGGVITYPDIHPDSLGERRMYSRKTHAFSISERRWVEGPDMPFEQNWGAACSLAGRLMVIAGAHRSESAGAYVFDNRVLAMRGT